MTDHPTDCPFRELLYCTFGHAGNVITIREDYNENGIIAKQASIRGVTLHQCNVDGCPLRKEYDNDKD